MLVWLTLPFCDFCGFRSVAVNSVYKLQFFYIYCYNGHLFCDTVTFAVSYNFCHDFAGKGMLNVLHGVLSK